MAEYVLWNYCRRERYRNFNLCVLCSFDVSKIFLNLYTAFCIRVHINFISNIKFDVALAFDIAEHLVKGLIEVSFFHLWK